MATIKKTKAPPPKTINKFLGMNQNTTGDTELQLGESPNMLNFRVKENYVLESIRGYEQLFASLGECDIQGMWYGKISGTYYFLFACGGKVYKHNMSTLANTEIGTLTDAKTHFFAFDDKVYMLNGAEYKYWDGTTFGDVAGYVPLVAVASPPAGGGTPYEVINALTGKKHKQYTPNGATVYYLPETSITSVDYVYVAGVLKTVTTDYTVDLTNGTVTFLVAPSGSVVNDVDLHWTKDNGYRTLITANTNAMFYGGKNDNRIFAYGNGTNKYYFTGLASGVPSAEYFPVTNYREVGSDEFEVTDIERQYDRQIIYTSGKETFYSYYDPITDNAGNVIADFPTYPLNNTIGNIAKGQVILIENSPFSIEQEGVFRWVATNVRDERNAENISKPVQPSLNALDLTKAITVDCKKVSEYWLAIGNKIFMYNYKLDLWYPAQIYDNITCFLVINGVVHFGTDNGQIMRFRPTLRSDNGHAKSYYWEMSFYDFDAGYLEKYINELLLSLKPEDRAGLVVQYQTNKDPLTTVATISYNLATFENADFSDWSFLTSYDPQPFKLRVNINRFVYFKLVLSRTTDNESITLLSINLPYRFGSRV